MLGAENLFSLIIQSILAVVLMFVLSRHGLVALIFCLLARSLLMDFPVTWDFSAWYAGASVVALGALGVMLGLSFYAARGGKPLLSLRVAT